MLSHVFKRYYGPLRLPIQPDGLSDLPYIHQLMALCHHRIGSPALHCYSSDTCHPCYPERSAKMIPLSYLSNSGLPHMTIESASPMRDEATYRFTFVTACIFGVSCLAYLPMGNLQPLITQTLLPGAKETYGQLPLLDFNQLE